jgi:hypothetical protein
MFGHKVADVADVADLGTCVTRSMAPLPGFGPAQVAYNIPNKKVYVKRQAKFAFTSRHRSSYHTDVADVAPISRDITDR